LTDREAVNHVIGGKFQMKRLVNIGLDHSWTPAAIFCDMRVDKRRA
jgi:hypothetical protein